MEQKWQTPQDLPGHLLSPLSELKSHGFDTLLQRLLGDLKVLEPDSLGCLLSLALGGRREGPGGEEWQKQEPRRVWPAVVRPVPPQ